MDEVLGRKGLGALPEIETGGPLQGLDLVMGEPYLRPGPQDGLELFSSVLECHASQRAEGFFLFGSEGLGFDGAHPDDHRIHSRSGFEC